MKSTLVLLVLASCLALSLGRNHNGTVCDGLCSATGFTHRGQNKLMPLKETEFGYCRKLGFCPTNLPSVTGATLNNFRKKKCTNGFVTIDAHLEEDGSGQYPCDNIDLLSYLPASALGSSGDTSDIWGTTITDVMGQDRKVTIVCHSDGTSFVDITKPQDPIIMGFLPTYDCGDTGPFTCTKNKIWRDVKTYNGVAYIVSENVNHGMQVFDINELYSDDTLVKGHVRVGEAPQTLTANFHYDGLGPNQGDAKLGHSHNIVLNEKSGFAYIVGANLAQGGLYAIDVKGDTPVFAGVFATDGYTHDAQCVDYTDAYPDSNFWGKEICFAYNEDTLTIVDVTDKSDMKEISRISYSGYQYTHQGWMTEDGKYLLMNDELDEVEGTTPGFNGDVTHGTHTRTMVWNVEDLSAPYWKTTKFSEHTVIDHNLYIRDGFAFESNYCAGLRVLDASDPTNMEEIAYFDVAPTCDGPVFSGSWSNYPYYDYDEDKVGGVKKFQTVAVSSIERGLYVLRVRLD